MSKKLTAHTLVRHDNGTLHSFGPKDNVPKWAEKLITNPDLWTDSGASAETTSTASASQAISDAAAVEAAAEAAAAQAAAEAEVSDTPQLVIPPKSGAGSGAEAWRDYAVQATTAADLHIDIPDDAGRNDIIAALDAAGIKTE